MYLIPNTTSEITVVTAGIKWVNLFYNLVSKQTMTYFSAVLNENSSYAYFLESVHLAMI